MDIHDTPQPDGVRQNPVSGGHLPALSPPFISADDAAYWAHTQIGSKRDREYGGAILKHAGRYFATVPKPGATKQIALDSVLPISDGKPVLPADYTCSGFYHSHPDTDDDFPSRTFPARQRSILRGLFSYPDMQVIFRLSGHVPAHYLSGPDGTLLKFVVRTQAKLQAFLTRLDPASHPEIDFFTDYVPQVAEAGALWVLVANAAWGGVRGRVSKDWVLKEWVKNTPLKGGERMQPFSSAVFASSQLSALIAFTDQAFDQPFWGYLLKAADRDEYVYVPGAGTVDEWGPPHTLFPPGADGQTQLPPGFLIEGVLMRLVDKTKPPFLPSHLASLVELLAYAPNLFAPLRPPTLLQRLPDGGLNSYRLSGTDAESLLLGKRGAVAQRQIETGALTVFRYFDRLASMGEMSVLKAGVIWQHPGKIHPWFEELQPHFSPDFLRSDDAARYLSEQVSRRDISHFGYILQRNDGRFVATGLITDINRMVSMGLTKGRVLDVLSLPADYRYYGFFVAVGSNPEELKRMLATQPDVEGRRSLDERLLLTLTIPYRNYVASLTADGQPIPCLYYSGTTGSLVKYVRSGSPQEREFHTALTAIIDTGTFKPRVDGFRGTPLQVVSKMASLGEFHVIETNAVFGNSRGRLPVTWTAFEPFASVPPVEPPYNWIVTVPELAAEVAHGQFGLTPDQRQVAFILKATGADAYFSTQPAPVGSRLFSPSTVFTQDANGDPVIPEGYEVHGICYQSLPEIGMKTLQHWLYESFVAPQDLAAVIAQARSNRTLRALYVSTRDGAQLRYRFSGTGLESQLYGVTPTGQVNDNGHQASLRSGAVTPTEYVLRVAAAGELSVLVAGRLWDVQGRVEQTWRPFARYRMPEFSAPFLQADDAARFAHEQVGADRYAEYCGCILKTPDQRFVATLPVACLEAQRFAIGTVFPADHSGVLLVPEPYVLYGQYASCRSVARLDKARMQHNGWSREEASVDWQLFNDADLRNLIGNRHWVSTGYLSCDEHALIAFDLTGAKDQLDELNPDTSSAPREPQARVRHLSASGLRIVLGSPLWGSPGNISPAWRAYAPAATFEKPQLVAFGAIFSTARDAVADAHVRLRRRSHAAQTGFAFLLKHAHEDHYVLSQVVPADAANPLFNLASLFGSRDDGAFIFPPAFELHGLYYARLWMPDNLQNPQRWLARHFLSSADLYSAFLSARRWRETGSGVTLPVFISTLDDAVLEYQADVSTPLFDPVKQPSGTFEDVHTQLSGGQLSPQAFVRKVIGMSWLGVLVPSECWDEESSRLGADWLPYADFSRRALSPAFFHQADALRYAHQRLGNRRDRIYGGLLLKRVDGLFVATEPLPVATENFDPKWILPDEDVRADWLAPGMTLVARYRSRRDVLPAFVLDEDGEAVYRAMLSTDVLGTALTCQHLWSHEYLFGLDGSVIGFSCRSAMDAAQQGPLSNDLEALRQALAPAERTPHDPLSNALEKQMRDGSLTPVAFVNRLLKVASMTVVQGSALWGNAQVLGSGWLPARGFTAPDRFIHASADRALGPVFSHIDDAARDAHERAGERDRLTYGFIFKLANGHWMASLPVDGEDRRFPYDRVVLGGRLPVGCTIAALYLCAPARQPEELRVSAVYHAFIPPSLLRAALAVVRTKTNAGAAPYLPLYLSCADGALLNYRASRLDSDWDGEAQMQAYIRLLNGNINPRDYIRQVALSGPLEVLVTGEIWTGKGRVSHTWSEGASAAEDPDARVALGPLFSHPDDAARYMWRRSTAVPGKAAMGAVLTNAAGNSYLVSEPVDDSGPSVHVGLRMNTSAYRRLFGGVMNLDERTQPRPKYPAGYHVMGVQQLHKWDASLERLADRHEQAIAENFISQKEFRFVVDLLRQDKVAGARYYFTPRQGALLVYAPSFERAEHDLLLFGWIDPESDKPRLKTSEALTILFNSGRLHVLEPDRFWQPKGHVASRFLMALRKAQQTRLRS